MNVGDRVRYRSKLKGWSTLRSRSCTGTITAIYPAHTVKNEDGEFCVPEFAAVRVDRRPSWWARPDTDTFAPETAELTPLPSHDGAVK